MIGDEEEIPYWVEESGSKAEVYWRAKYSLLRDVYNDSTWSQQTRRLTEQATPSIGGAGATIEVNTDPMEIFQRIELVVAMLSGGLTILSVVLSNFEIQLLPLSFEVGFGLLTLALLIDYFINRRDSEGENRIPP